MSSIVSLVLASDGLPWGVVPLQSRNPFLASVPPPPPVSHSRNPFYSDIFAGFDDDDDDEDHIDNIVADDIMALPKLVVLVPSPSQSPSLLRPALPTLVVLDVSHDPSLVLTTITTPASGSNSSLACGASLPPLTMAPVIAKTATTPQPMELLLLLEPNPVKPPLYSLLPPGGMPRYNVLDTTEPDRLPSYQPLVYKLAVVLRKPEWILPYAPATLRLWKYVVAELNLTQVNFYGIPSHLELAVISFQAQDPASLSSSTSAYRDLAHLDSAMTTPQDLAMHRHCQRLGIFGDRKRPPLLLRLYSLHHAKMGLATDYKKRNNVLRVRMELEQFLLGFESVQHLIDWNAALSAGRDLAPDVNDRELPKYRTVPRRRRRHRRSASLAAALGDLLSTHMPTRPRLALDPARIFRKIKRKFSSTNLQQQLQSTTLSPAPPRAHSLMVLVPLAAAPAAPLSPRAPLLFALHSALASALASLAPLPLPTPRLRSLTRGASDDDDEQEDVEMADLRDVDDEDEEDDLALDDELRAPLRPRAPTALPLRARLALTGKWRPDDTVPLRYRYYKHCLRCIKPLTLDDTWVGRLTVRPVAQPTFSERPGPTREVDDHLGRIRLHYLQECIVCPQGLVPRV